MAEDRLLPYGSPLPAAWLVAIQEFVSTLSANFVLSLADAHTVQVIAGVSSAQAALGIDGLFRYVSATVQSAVTGAAGTYDIFAVTGPNNIVPQPGVEPPELDLTDYTFALQALPHGTTPSLTGTVTNYRLVGQVDFDGTNITGLRQFIGEGNALIPVTATASGPKLNAIRTIGASGQTAALQTWEQSGVVVAKMNPDGSLTINQKLLALTLEVTGVATFDSSPTMPTPGATDNSTKGATTAFVQRAISGITFPLLLTREKYVWTPQGALVVPSGETGVLNGAWVPLSSDETAKIVEIIYKLDVGTATIELWRTAWGGAPASLYWSSANALAVDTTPRVNTGPTGGVTVANRDFLQPRVTAASSDAQNLSLEIVVERTI